MKNSLLRVPSISNICFEIYYILARGTDLLDLETVSKHKPHFLEDEISGHSTHWNEKTSSHSETQMGWGLVRGKEGKQCVKPHYFMGRKLLIFEQCSFYALNFFSGGWLRELKTCGVWQPLSHSAKSLAHTCYSLQCTYNVPCVVSPIMGTGKKAHYFSLLLIQNFELASML